MTAIVPGSRYIKKNGALVALDGGSGGGATGGVLDRINARFALSPTRAVRMVFTGSSTTEANPGYVTPLVAAIQAAYPSGGTEMAVRNSLTATFDAPSTAPGVQGYNAAVGGTYSGNFVTTDTVPRIGALNPDVIQIMVGSNDIGIVSPAAYKANLSSKIADLKAVAPSCLFVLVHSYQRMDGTPTTPWADYGNAMAEVAAADPTRVVALDLSGLYVAAGVPGADPANLIDTDNIHQTAAGYALMTEAMKLALGVPKVPATTPAPDTTAPSVPTGLTATAGNAQVVLSWNASTDAVGVTGYRVYRGGTLIASPTGTTYTDTGRTNGTQYSYTVAAADAAGNVSAQTAAVTATPTAPADVTAPTTPTGLTAGTPTQTTVPLSWTASTDAVGVTGYKVRRGGTVVGTPAGTSYTDTGLTASTAYSYTVSAVDAAGNESAQTGAVNATTAAAAPAQTTLASDNFDRADGPIGTAPTGQTWSGDPFTISGGRVSGGAVTSVDVGTGDVDVSVDVIYASTSSAGLVFNTLDGPNRLVYYANGSAVTLAKLDAGALSVLGGGGAGLVTTGATHTLRAVSKGAQITCYLNGAQVISYTLTADEQTKYKPYTRVGLRHSAGTGNYLDNFDAKTAP